MLHHSHCNLLLCTIKPIRYNCSAFTENKENIIHLKGETGFLMLLNRLGRYMKKINPIYFLNLVGYLQVKLGAVSNFDYLIGIIIQDNTSRAQGGKTLHFQLVNQNRVIPRKTWRGTKEAGRRKGLNLITVQRLNKKGQKCRITQRNTRSSSTIALVKAINISLTQGASMPGAAAKVQSIIILLLC